MKFIHTADWQIGMKSLQVGTAGERVRDERIDAVSRVLRAAEDEGADFILVAGDTFEDNGVDRVFVQKVADILGKFNGRVYLIPGNHDPLVPGSVWEYPAWASHDNLCILDKAEPVEIPGGILYPCPVYEKRSGRNPIQWIQVGQSESIAVAVAHGTVEGIQLEEAEYPIPRDAPASTGLDYLALGHWHSTATYTDSASATRMAYSGTHETSRFGERDSGNVLLVEIPKRGQVPILTPIRIGRLSWLTIEHTLQQCGDLGRVRKIVEDLQEPSFTLLDVRIKGVFWAEECHEISRISEIVQSRFLFGRVDCSGLIPCPQDESWAVGLPAGALRDAALRLRELADPNNAEERPLGASHEVASQALLELYALAKEVSG